MCECAVCVRHKRWTAALDPHTEDAIAAWEEVQCALAIAEDDACYWRMKYQGTWPGDRATDHPAEVQK